MRTRKRKISVIGASQEDLERTTKMIVADSNDEAVDEVIVEFEEPLADALAELAWPWPENENQNHYHPKPPFPVMWHNKLADSLSRFKVLVAGIRKEPKPTSKVSLFVGTYMDYQVRATEMIDCLETNIQNPHIEDIHLFIEDPVLQWKNWLNWGAWEAPESGISPENAPSLRGFPPMAKYDALDKLSRLSGHPKVKLVPWGRRGFFSEYFEYANKNLPTGRSVVLANADIQFGADVGLLAEHDLTGVFGCLARNGGRIFDKPPGAPASMSSDAWMFQTPLEKVDATFPLGVRAGEYLLSFTAFSAGYVLLNPCLSIYGKHCHTSQIRHWPRFPWITPRMHCITGVGLEALTGKKFAMVKKHGVCR